MFNAPNFYWEKLWTKLCAKRTLETQRWVPDGPCLQGDERNLQKPLKLQVVSSVKEIFAGCIGYKMIVSVWEKQRAFGQKEDGSLEEQDNFKKRRGEKSFLRNEVACAN